MADFKLARGELLQGGGTTGLRPALISPEAAAAASRGRLQIPLGAGTRKFTPVPIPQAVKDQTSDSILKFMGVTAEAVFKYEEREAEYLANQAALEYSTKLRQRFEGHENPDGSWTPGYSAALGDVARTEYGSYKNYVDSEFEKAMADMEPRVKQRAILKMQPTRNTYMGKAASHRSKQMMEAREQQLYMLRKDIEFEIGNDPYSYNTPDPVTGLTPKQRYFNTYMHADKAQKGWHDMVQAVGENIFLDIATSADPSNPLAMAAATQQAAAAARQFYETVGKVELANSLDHQKAMRGNIKSWTNESIRAANSAFDTEHKLFLRAQNMRYKRTESRLSQMEAGGEIVSMQELEDLFAADEIDPSFYRIYKRDHFGDILAQPDQSQVKAAMNELTRAKNNGWRYEDGSVVTPGDWYTKYDKLKPAGRKLVDDHYAKLRNPDTGDQLARGEERIEILTQGKFFQKVIAKQELEDNTWLAKEHFRGLLAAGIKYEQALEMTLTQWNPATTQLNLLSQRSPLTTQIQMRTPTTVEEAEIASQELREAHISGLLTENELDLEVATLDRYIKYIIAADRFLRDQGYIQ